MYYFNKKNVLSLSDKSSLTSVNEIEELTGLDFLIKLLSKIENSVEESVAESLRCAKKEDFIDACRD